jgi:membrane-associated phospholipid phosphatase
MNKSFVSLLKRHLPFIIPFLVLVVVCVIILLTNTKAESFLWTNIHHNEFFDEFFKAITLIADLRTTILIILGMVLIKYRYAILTAIAFSYSAVVVQILKRIFDSPRPSKFFDKLNPIRTIEGYPLYEVNSFPSGHSAAAFTLAVLLSYLMPHKKRHWLIIPMAVLIAFSRVYLAQHFFQDVFAGAVIGVVLTFQVIWWLENTAWYHSEKLDGKLFGK